MLREQVINFLEAMVVLLMLTNAFSVAAAAYAIALAKRAIPAGSGPATQPRVLALLASRLRASP